MLEQPMFVAKVRQQTAAELYALKVMKKRKVMLEGDLINKITDKGFKKTEAQQSIIYLINGYEIERKGFELCLISWDM